MNDIPDIDAVLSKLGELAHVKVDPDVPISQADVSSLDLVEWTVLLEDDYQVSLEDVRIDDLRNLTPRMLFESLFGNRSATPPGSQS